MEGVEGWVGGVEAEAEGAAVDGLVEFVEGEEGERGAVVSFDVGGVEAEDGGAIEGCGTEVFWGVGEGWG